MILPIVGYGHPTLRKVSQPIDQSYPNLKELVANMYETMYAADGVGLAAPQVDLPIRVVVIGFRPYDEKTDTYGEVTEQHTLINPEILEFGEQKDWFNEGCLSVPDIHEDVLRPTTVRVHFWDENWVEHTDDATGLYARVVQHEVDHLNGKVFTDRLSSLRKTLLRKKLNAIADGKVQTKYRMKKAKKSCLAVCLAALLLMVGCGPNRDKDIQAITQQEENLSQIDLIASDEEAQTLLKMYHDFAADFPDDSLAPVYLLRASDMYITLGHPEAAVPLLDSLIALYPGFEDVGGCWFNLGRAYEEMDEVEASREAYTYFVENYPEHPLAKDTRYMIENNMVGKSPEEILEAILNSSIQQ